MNIQLSSKDIQKLKFELLKLMEEKKPYLDKELSLNKLANELNTTIIELSHVIDKELNQNFNSFINEYRVQEMKQSLQDDSLNFTFIALSKKAGFKSKAAFHVAFKKSTGMTPTNYMKSIQTVKR